MNVEIIDRLIDQDPALESARAALAAMKVGACCIHRSWGFGKIAGFESEKGMLLVDFEEDEVKSHPMDPVFCLGKLEVLDDDHISDRIKVNAERIVEFASRDFISGVRVTRTDENFNDRFRRI